MAIPIIDLDSPTRLAVHWGWLLATAANLVVAGFVVLVFVLGLTVRMPGARRDLDLALREGTGAEPTGTESGTTQP